MSQRFAPLASQHDLSRRHRQVRGNVVVLTLAQLPSLPWFELLLGAAFLIVMRAI